MKNDQPLRKTMHTAAGEPPVDVALRLVAARRAFEPPPGAARRSRRRLQAQISAGYRRNPWRVWSDSAIRWWQSPRLHVAMVTLLAAMLYFNLASFLQASQYWLPGDFLYPIKPAAESLHLLASLSPQRDAELHIEYAHRRLIEVQGLVFENRYEAIPATVKNFDYHVAHAVTLVNDVAVDEAGGARGLARALQATLTRQTALLAVLSDFSPLASQNEFERMMTISTGGVQGVNDLLPPEPVQDGV